MFGKELARFDVAKKRWGGSKVKEKKIRERGFEKEMARFR